MGGKKIGHVTFGDDTDEDPKKVRDKKKFKSASDVRHDNGTITPGGTTPGTHAPRRKKLLNSFRKKREKWFRGTKNSKENDVQSERLSASQPNISNYQEEIENFYESATAGILRNAPERSLSDPTLTPQLSTKSNNLINSQSGSQDQNDEVDSGIAVIEQSPSVSYVLFFLINYS
ncbi:hypothetical protein LOTGIDRAFT_164919 [Lottia gigantea]|uniref:Uncharacterized protein n=1 Tax=Lottia gigantea TaxID=225164 RepID=V3ZYY8_LOTGI|nr:hypothetical protein LOTGIDRAFT_164919 [Lottia gigantea]ESO89617.1 hypothetical protein LOTGIDRAFT_164919 [Lottia gigantea]